GADINLANRRGQLERIVNLHALRMRWRAGVVADHFLQEGFRQRQTGDVRALELEVADTVAGTQRASNGVGNFQLESADVSGLPLPKTFLQEMVSYYSRTPAHPQGVKIDDPFELPASIRQIDVSA